MLLNRNHYIGNAAQRISENRSNAIQVIGFDAALVSTSFSKRVQDARTQLLPEGSEPPKKLSPSSLRKLEFATMEATITSSDKASQNKRRLQALQDAYNYLALLIVLFVLFCAGKPPIDPRLMFNTDKSSDKFGKELKTVILTNIGVKDNLAEANRNPTITSSGLEDKKRGIAYSAMTSAAGVLVSLCTHIKDKFFNHDGCVKTYKLAEGEFLQTIPTSLNDEVGSEAFLESIAEQEAGIILFILYDLKISKYIFFMSRSVP
jgi:hypothetical protein